MELALLGDERWDETKPIKFTVSRSLKWYQNHGIKPGRRTTDNFLPNNVITEALFKSNAGYSVPLYGHVTSIFPHRNPHKRAQGHFLPWGVITVWCRAKYGNKSRSCTAVIKSCVSFYKDSPSSRLWRPESTQVRVFTSKDLALSPAPIGLVQMEGRNIYLLWFFKMPAPSEQNTRNLT